MVSIRQINLGDAVGGKPSSLQMHKDSLDNGENLCKSLVLKLAILVPKLVTLMSFTTSFFLLL